MSSDLEILQREMEPHNSEKSAKLIVSGNEILDEVRIEGISLDVKRNGEVFDIDLVVEENVKLENPIHVCFGAIHDEVNQNINFKILVKKNSVVNFISHCVLTSEKKINHKMNSVVEIMDGASYSYFEKHLHSDDGDININSDVKMKVGKNVRVKIDYNLVKGRFGNSEFIYDIDVGEKSKVDMESKMSLSRDDKGLLDEKVSLNGKDSGAVVKSRVVVRENSVMNVRNRIVANEEGCVGHIDCSEVLLDNGKTCAYPEAIVNHPKARVTHEAALGGIDNKKLETLMARGLSEKEAEDLILEGMLG